MQLQRLSITDVRNLNADLTDLGRVNVFTGHNGSGKTSVLEALHLLGLGRSFRSNTARSVIRHEARALTVFAEFQQPEQPGLQRLGIHRSLQGEVNLRLNGEPLTALADLAQRLPLLLVNADTFGLLEGAPRLRRQFLDWGVFHMEHDFYPAWKSALRCLKHRNSLLRHGRLNPKELDAWDERLAASAEVLHACRDRYWQRFLPRLERALVDMGAVTGLMAGYAPGWDASLPYREVLLSQRERDTAQRQTGSGPHRADLLFRLHGHDAADTLSRGQKKMAVLALRMAQADVLAEMTGRVSLFLLDDLPAELDSDALLRVAHWLRDRPHQVFITSILPETLRAFAGVLGQSPRWFHVEHGQIRAATPEEVALNQQ